MAHLGLDRLQSRIDRIEVQAQSLDSILVVDSMGVDVGGHSQFASDFDCESMGMFGGFGACKRGSHDHPGTMVDRERVLFVGIRFDSPDEGKECGLCSDGDR